jgi:hypothetical protein
MRTNTKGEVTMQRNPRARRLDDVLAAAVGSDATTLSWIPANAPRPLHIDLTHWTLRRRRAAPWQLSHVRSVPLRLH